MPWYGWEPPHYAFHCYSGHYGVEMTNAVIYSPAMDIPYLEVYDHTGHPRCILGVNEKVFVSCHQPSFEAFIQEYVNTMNASEHGISVLLQKCMRRIMSV